MRAPIDIIKKPFPVRPDLKTMVEFNKKDGNGNGVLTSDEYGVGKETQDEFRRYDSNNDGKLSLDEFARGRRMDQWRDQINIGIKPPFPYHKVPGKEASTEPAKGAGEAKKEEPSFFQKAFPWLALTNPITAPIGAISLFKKLFD